jgi:Holliday junction resolvasome RuvABC ATP-dependent DNA helicase subunit
MSLEPKIIRWDDFTDFDRLMDSIMLVNNESIHFVGQDAAKEQLSVFLDADSFPNTLIMGDAGLGKTYLAKWVAGKRRTNVQLHRDLPMRPKDLDRQIPFVILDECHMQKNVEWLFPLMENPKFTFIGTTNMPEKLPEAFKSRFIVQVRLRPYSVEEMALMVSQEAPDISDEWATVLASAGGGNPRQLQRIMSTAKALDDWNPQRVLGVVRINADGISEDHLLYLAALEAFDRPIGLQYLSSQLSIDQAMCRSLERLLLDKGLITLEPNGRALASHGAAYLKLMRERNIL